MSKIRITLDGKKKVSAHLKGHVITTDQPIDSGGDNSAPAPFDLFLASLGTCAGIYIKYFCDQRNIDTSGIEIIQSVEYDHQKRLPSIVKLDINLPGDFPEKYKDAVINAAQLCAVKRAIADPPVFEIVTSIK
jgi:putative redox protein